MEDQQLKVRARAVAQRCSESERVEADTLGTQVIERAGHLPIDAQPFLLSITQSKQLLPNDLGSFNSLAASDCILTFTLPVTR